MGPLMICNAVEVIIRVYEAYEVYEASGPMGSTGGQGEGVSGGQGGHLQDLLGPSGWFDECSYDSQGIYACMQDGRSWAGHGGPPPKSLDSDENFKPEHTLFCRELRFVVIYALFRDLWAKKGAF